MQVALDKRNIRKIAWKTERQNGPFRCPGCKQEVILRKGKIKEHHFAHKSKSDCLYGFGETDLHYKVKRELYENLLRHNTCKNVEMEKNLNGIVSDISCYIDKYPVAFEIQKSAISIDYLLNKFRDYNKIGIYVTYILPSSKPKLFKKYYGYRDEDGNLDFYEFCRPNQWERLIHAIYFGRVYYWINGLDVLPCHYDKVETYIEATDFGGGYCKTLKTEKYPKYHKKLNLVDDFNIKIRNQYKLENYSLPKCKLWMDCHLSWW